MNSLNDTENSARAFPIIAQAYCEGVSALLAARGGDTGERGGVGPAKPEELATQAEKLAPLSAELTKAAATLVTDADPKVRVDAPAKLLAKSIVDLQVSARLFQADEDELAGVAASGARSPERSSAALGAPHRTQALDRRDGRSGRYLRHRRRRRRGVGPRW